MSTDTDINMNDSIFNKFSNTAQSTEGPGGAKFIYGKYGKIAETDDPEVYDVHIVGPYLNPICPEVLNRIIREGGHLIDRLTLLTGEATGDVSVNNVLAVADLLQIKPKRKHKGNPNWSKQ